MKYMLTLAVASLALVAANTMAFAETEEVPTDANVPTGYEVAGCLYSAACDPEDFDAMWQRMIDEAGEGDSGTGAGDAGGAGDGAGAP